MNLNNFHAIKSARQEVEYQQEEFEAFIVDRARALKKSMLERFSSEFPEKLDTSPIKYCSPDSKYLWFIKPHYTTICVSYGLVNFEFMYDNGEMYNCLAIKIEEFLQDNFVDDFINKWIEKEKEFNKSEAERLVAYKIAKILELQKELGELKK